MANTKISALPAATSVSTADLLPLVQGGVTKQTTPDLLPLSTAASQALAAKAPLASPAFTGTPTVPTATAGTTSTQAASTAFVAAAILALINSAPGALDTLGELAAQLGTDENAASALTTLVTQKTLGGATNALSANGALAGSRPNTVDATSTAVTVTLPTPAVAGQLLAVEKIDTSANAVTVSGTIRGSASTLTLSGQFEAILFEAESLTSWRPIAGHKTKAYLDTLYAQLSQVAPLAQAGQTPSQAPVAPSGTATVGTLAEAARADHVHPSAGLFAFYGNGSDGVATFDGTSTPAGVSKTSSTLYRATRDLYYTSATIAAGVTLDMSGFQLYVRGVLAGPGTGSHATITCIVPPVSGTNNGTAGAYTPGGATSTLQIRTATLGFGVRGATGVVGVGVAPTTVSYQNNLNPSTTAGGAGGAGGSGAGGAALGNGSSGGNNGSQFAWKKPHACLTGTITAIDSASPGNTISGVLMGGIGGSSGAGDGTNVGGAGGCGGHVVIVNALTVTGLVDVTAPGGAGGSPTTGNCGGGGGGAGGLVYVNSTDLSGWTGTASAPGGAGGTGIGTGSAGSAGGTGLTAVTAWA